MTIRSVDMQVLLPKAGEVAKLQQAQRLEHIHRQYDNKDAIVQQTFSTAKQVGQTVRGATPYVDEQPDKKEKKKNKQPKDKEQKSRQTVRPSEEDENHIDITI